MSYYPQTNISISNISETWENYKKTANPKEKTEFEARLINIFKKISDNNQENIFRVLNGVNLSDTDKKEVYVVAARTLFGDSCGQTLETYQNKEAKFSNMQLSLEIACELMPLISKSHREEALRDIVHFINSSSPLVDKKFFIDWFKAGNFNQPETVLKHLPSFYLAISPHLNKMPSDLKSDALKYLLTQYKYGIEVGGETWLNGFKNSLSTHKNFTEHIVHALLLAQIEKGDTSRVEKYLLQLKMGERGAVEQKLVFGPQEKNRETVMVQSIISKLFKDINNLTIECIYNEVEDKCTFYIVEDGKRLRYHDGKEVELQEMLKNTNFNHILLTDEDIKQFEKLLKSEEFKGLKPSHKNPYPTTGPEGALLEGEKDAINIYTTSAFSNLIPFMQGKITDAIENAESMSSLPGIKKRNNRHLKSLLLTAAVAVRGLNKLPNYDPTAGPDGKEAPFLFRKERKPDSVLQTRIEAVRQGGTIVTETGLISTSRGGPPSSPEYKMRNIVTLFHRNGCYCKDIHQLSDVPSEDEILLTPTQIQWQSYRELHPLKIDDKNGNITSEIKHLFIARAVTVNTKTPTIPKSKYKAPVPKPRRRKIS